MHIERFPLARKQWAGEMAELWVTEPGTPQLITSFRDVTATLATGSHSADVTADLVFVGRGDSADDYKDKDGRARSSSAPVPSARRTISPSASSAPRASSASSTPPASRSIARIRLAGAASAAAGGARSRRGGAEDDVRLHPVAADGSDLLSPVEKHQHVKVHAIVKADRYHAPMQVVVATIPGDESTNEEFLFTAHLFEGIAKQGANDNCGGPPRSSRRAARGSH